MAFEIVEIGIGTGGYALEGGVVRVEGESALFGAGVVVACSVGLNKGRVCHRTARQAGH